MKLSRFHTTLLAAWSLFATSFFSSSKTFAQLVINEVCVANIDRFIDPSYNYGAWIELYNPSLEEVKLADLKIRHTDADNKVTQHTLTTSHGSVPPQGFSIVWFDHNSKSGYYGSYASTQIPFKLDADGGIIELLNINHELLDAVAYPPCIARCSWMRVKDGDESFGWTSSPSPRKSNNDSPTASQRLQAPIVNGTGGTFNENFAFQVLKPEGTTLYYTTNGETPEVGTSPISNDGLFSGSTNTIFRFMLASEGYLDSPVVTCSFIKSDTDYSLPILCVNTAPKNFFDDTIGLYTVGKNGRVANNSKVRANQNMDWERPVNMEYFTPDEMGHFQEVINQETSFSIFGGWTRFNPGNENFQYRSSFKLKSDKVFEHVNVLPYPIFGSKPHIKIKNILVRNGGQDNKARIWDASIHEILRTSGVYIDCQAWQPSHVFLNGKYLGMMNLREESNHQFAFSNYGIDKDEIDQWEGDITIKVGDKKKLDEWYSLANKLADNPSDKKIWDAICQLVDIDEFCNYMATETYIGNSDWLKGGSLKNLKGFRAKDENGKFHIVLHDVDLAFTTTDLLLQVLSKGTGSLPVRFKNMLKYEPFKKQFIDAYCLMHGSVFAPEHAVPIINEMREIINRALRLEGLSSDEKADLLIGRLCDEEERRPTLIETLKTAFDLTDEYHVTLHANAIGATLRLNGQEIPTGRFRGSLFPPITLKVSIPDGYIFQGWKVNGEIASTDTELKLSEQHTVGDFTIEADFQQKPSSHAPLRINEVSAGNDIFIDEFGKKGDWVELYNRTEQDIDLQGMFLSDNPEKLHKFKIPAFSDGRTIVPAHGYKVIWCDDRESETQLHAPFKLKNADNAFIAITAEDDTWTDSLHYRAQPRWFTFGRYPDGGGELALFERPTIDNANRVCTSTQFTSSGGEADIPTPHINTDRQIQSIRYFNLYGQQISSFEGEQIVIQQILYKDGTSISRKITTFAY